MNFYDSAQGVHVKLGILAKTIKDYFHWEQAKQYGKCIGLADQRLVAIAVQAPIGQGDPQILTIRGVPNLAKLGRSVGFPNFPKQGYYGWPLGGAHKTV